MMSTPLRVCLLQTLAPCFAPKRVSQFEIWLTGGTPSKSKTLLPMRSLNTKVVAMASGRLDRLAGSKSRPLLKNTRPNMMK